MDQHKQNIIIYNTVDGKASVSLFAKDGMAWMNQNQMAELFDTSKQNIGQHIANILKEKELDENSVVKNYFTTAPDGKKYNVTFYTLDMILAVGFRVRSKRGTQFRIWANRHYDIDTKGYTMCSQLSCSHIRMIIRINDISKNKNSFLSGRHGACPYGRRETPLRQ